ncbi:MAG TPA: hypothetical protein VMF58_01855 [Rhizomicrobium sp.]|nr:hypothetical protein [Rhizomicrobium sp.]
MRGNTEDQPSLSASNSHTEDDRDAAALLTPDAIPFPARDQRRGTPAQADGSINAARRFLDLAAADHVLFDAIQALEKMGFPEHAVSLRAERSRIVGRLTKLQSAAYREFEGMMTKGAA